jgi:hypothetical protein
MACGIRDGKWTVAYEITKQWNLACEINNERMEPKM